VEHAYAPVYSPICEEPCAARLVPGEYQLAVAKEGGRPIPVREPVAISGPSSVRTHYMDRSALRAAGWVTAVAGTIGGAIMIGLSARGQEFECDSINGSNTTCFRREVFNGGLLGGGIAIVVGAAVAGSILASQRDEAHVTIEPLTAPSFGSRRESPIAAVNRLAPVQGAAVGVKF
jgi:hypothetical protein